MKKLIAKSKSEPTVTLKISGFPEKGLAPLIKMGRIEWSKILFNLKLGRFNFTLTKGEK